MSDDRRALVAAIVAAPDDDLPRLVFADWLEEHGEADRAKFIRLQCEAARTAGGAEYCRRAKGEEAKLQKKHLQEWVGPIAPERIGSPYTGVGPFSRGLLREWHGSAAEFLKRDAQQAMADWFPSFGVNELTLWNPTKKPAEVFASPVLEWVPLFQWRHAKVGDDAFVALAASPHVRNFVEFSMTHPRCTDAGLTAFAKSKNLPRLQSLVLSDALWGGEFTTKGVLRVLNSDRLPLLESFALMDNMPSGFKPAGFLRDEGLARLKRLSMPGTAGHHWKPHDGIAALAASPHVGALEHLDLSGNDLSDETALALADNPHFTNLKALDLTDLNNTTKARLSPKAEQRLRDRFGDVLAFEYGVLVKDG